MMKKLLFVALIPLLVLGFIGCGGGIEEGEPLPYFVQGTYIGIDADNALISFILAPTQLTVFKNDGAGNIESNSIYRSGFENGAAGNYSTVYKTIGAREEEDGDWVVTNTATLSLYNFVGGGEIATIKFIFGGKNGAADFGDDDAIIDESDNVLYVSDVWFDGDAQTYQLPIKGSYKRVENELVDLLELLNS